MPIFRSGGKVIYFCHVPRCGGMAVSAYLSQRFGPLAFHDTTYIRAGAAAWSRTSPQHIDRETLGRLFGPDFFDVTFATVRHPVDRIVSIYLFQRQVEGSIPSIVSFSDWLDDLEDRRAEDPFSFDNHVRPMCDMVPEGAVIFPVENGLEPLQAWLDDLTGQVFEGDPISRFGPAQQDTAPRGKTPEVIPTDSDLVLIDRLFRRDFERFGYRSENWVPTPLSAGPGPIERVTRRLLR